MVERDAVRRAYDELAETYAAQRSEGGRGTEVLAEFLDSLPESPRVLDAGCGQGTPVLRRLDAVGPAVGVDFSREQLRLARTNAPGASLARGDMTALPFDDDAFDAVVAYWSLIHVPLADHPTVVEEFARVVRPGGRVLLCEGTEEWVGENPDWLDGGVEMQWEIAGARATRNQLRNAGFDVVEEWGVPEPFESDDEESDDRTEGDDSGGDEDAWTFFAARLDPEASTAPSG
ncbi:MULTISPECIES: class I SAM-dependent methyltransferase [Halorussus]|uniref:class I SAM-dependent methyltransferase n=1 Tax=Halorussus TaxID=1070314 RepID=UPI00209D607B|nr:class I SAM-dependent methyltransferase [Halorussus vallis]USZ77791.1 class I SAM-dependent methyltransferase [Halorussus vallis]